MTITEIPFNLNGKPGILAVDYAPNQSLTASGFDLLAGCGFDVNMCLGYPTMRVYVRQCVAESAPRSECLRGAGLAREQRRIAFPDPDRRRAGHRRRRPGDRPLPRRRRPGRPAATHIRPAKRCSTAARFNGPP